MSATDLLHEQLVAVAEIPKHLPKRVHVSTCHRWYVRGIRGRKLETVLIGGRRFTTREALHRFFKAISDSEAHQQDTEPEATRDALINQAERELQSP